MKLKGKPYFLSRPRQYGKSLLLSAMKAYWEGKKELFSEPVDRSESKTGLRSVILVDEYDKSLLYQTGYLTIVDYDSIRRRFTLGFPNEEVKYGFLESLMPSYVPSVAAGNKYHLHRTY